MTDSSFTRPEDRFGHGEFSIYIDFEKGGGDPARVFRAAEAMVTSFDSFDATLCMTIGAELTTSIVLEEISGGSIRAKFRSVVQSLDDDAIKDLSAKKLIGGYLIRGKYILLDWLSKEDPKLRDLSEEITLLAKKTDVKRFPHYQPPPLKQLASHAIEFDRARANLNENDELFFQAPGGISMKVSTSSQLKVNSFEEQLIKETSVFKNSVMNLIVKKPDYLGSSKWDFRHGRMLITAKIEDEHWLEKFQTRQIDVRPGDALRCQVRIENSYGYDNELLKQAHFVTEVIDTLGKQIYEQPPLLSGDDWEH